MVNAIHRATAFVRRRRAASRLGFCFTGMRNPVVPDAIQINGGKVALDFPEDDSLFYEIVSIWLDDEYGLRNLKSPQKK